MPDAGLSRRVRNRRSHGLGLYRLVLFSLPVMTAVFTAAPFFLRDFMELDMFQTTAICSISGFVLSSIFVIIISKGLFARLKTASEASQRILEDDLSAKPDLETLEGALQPVGEMACTLLEQLEDYEDLKDRASTLEKEIGRLTDATRRAAAGDLTVNTKTEGMLAQLGDRLSVVLAGYREVSHAALDLASRVEYATRQGKASTMPADEDIQTEASRLAEQLAELYSRIRNQEDSPGGLLEETSQRLGIACLNLSRTVSAMGAEAGLDVISLAHEIALECKRFRSSLKSTGASPGISKAIADKIRVTASRAGTLARMIESNSLALQGMSSSAEELFRAASRVQEKVGLLRLEYEHRQGTDQETTGETDGNDESRGDIDQGVEDKGKL